MKEVPQKDTALLLNDVTSIKDTLKELKRQVAVQSHELVNLKNDKTNEQSNISREKEKSTVLFL